MVIKTFNIAQRGFPGIFCGNIIKIFIIVI